MVERKEFINWLANNPIKWSDATVFKGEMCSKTFLFLGYSFSDPNIHHILARIRKVYDKNAK